MALLDLFKPTEGKTPVRIVIRSFALVLLVMAIIQDYRNGSANGVWVYTADYLRSTYNLLASIVNGAMQLITLPVELPYLSLTTQPVG